MVDNFDLQRRAVGRRSQWQKREREMAAGTLSKVLHVLDRVDPAVCRFAVVSSWRRDGDVEFAVRRVGGRRCACPRLACQARPAGKN